MKKETSCSSKLSYMKNIVDMRPDMQIVVTDHPLSIQMCEAISQGTGWPLVSPSPGLKRVAVYGILRGCGGCLKAAEEFWYIDHGYFRSAVKSVYQQFSATDKGPYYRVVHNKLWHSHVHDGSDWLRFYRLGLDIKKFRKNGSHIVIVPPSIHMSKFWGLEGWLERTTAHLRNFTDRPIYIHRKSSKEPLKAALENAWCLITDHSNAAIDALMEGIPVIITHRDRSIGLLEDVESPLEDTAFFARLANNQWTMDEIRGGEPWK